MAFDTDFKTAPRRPFLEGEAYWLEEVTGAPRPYVSGVHLALWEESPADHRRIQAELAADPALKYCAYIGAGGLVNLGYIAALQPQSSQLFDINPLQPRFLRQAVQATQDKSKGAHFLKDLPQVRSAFLRDLLCRPEGRQIEAWLERENPTPRDHDYLKGFRGDVIAADMDIARDPDVYGLSPAAYRPLRQALARADMRYQVADIRDAAACGGVAAGLPSTAPRVIYASNILRFTKMNTDFANFPSGAAGHWAAYKNLRDLAFSGASAGRVILSLDGERVELCRTPQELADKLKIDAVPARPFRPAPARSQLTAAP